MNNHRIVIGPAPIDRSIAISRRLSLRLENKEITMPVIAVSATNAATTNNADCALDTKRHISANATAGITALIGSPAN